MPIPAPVINTIIELQMAGDVRAIINDNFDALRDYVLECSLSTHTHADYATTAAMTAALANKVDTVPGYGLSQNDFTDLRQARLETAWSHAGAPHASVDALVPADIADDLVTDDATKVLSAAQGVVIQTALTNRVLTANIVDDLTTGGAAVPLSADQGVALKTLVDDRVRLGDDTTAAEAATVGTLRYIEDGVTGSSKVEICMRTDDAAYAWIELTDISQTWVV